MTTTTTNTMRMALRGDLDEGARTLTAAFQHDPWFSWLFPDEAERPRQLSAWFELVLGRAFGMGHSYAGPSAFADWAPPDVHFPQPDDVALAVALLTTEIGERAQDAFAIIGRLGGMFPDEPRFHCVYVGVRPEAQGHGTGAALMRRVLDTCDREGLAASLTSTNAANVPFYRRLGFTELGAVPIADTGHSMRPMWRTPR